MICQNRNRKILFWATVFLVSSLSIILYQTASKVRQDWYSAMQISARAGAAAFDGSPIATFVCDARGDILTSNGEAIFNFNDHTNIFSIFDEQSRDNFKKRFDCLVKSIQQNSEIWSISSQGSWLIHDHARTYDTARVTMRAIRYPTQMEVTVTIVPDNVSVQASRLARNLKP